MSQEPLDPNAVKPEDKKEEVKYDFTKVNKLTDIPEYRDLLHENMKKKDQIKDLKTGQEDINTQLATIKENERIAIEAAAKEKGDFQELYAGSQTKLEQEQEANKLLKGQLESNNAKFELGRAMDEVEKQIQFARPHYKQNFPISDVRKVDGKYDMDHLKLLCDSFKQNSPELVAQPHSGINPTGKAPLVNGTGAKLETKNDKAQFVVEQLFKDRKPRF